MFKAYYFKTYHNFLSKVLVSSEFLGSSQSTKISVEISQITHHVANSSDELLVVFQVFCAEMVKFEI